MALPPAAKTFAQAMDPSDLVDYSILLSQGDDQFSFLQPAEEVVSFTLVMSAEAIAAGLQVKTDVGYSTTLLSNVVTFWLYIAPGSVGSSLFAGGGVTLGLELTVTTNSTPPRIRQRTVAVTVANQ